MGNFVRSVNEWIYLGYFIGCFDGTSNDMGDTCVGMIVEGIIIESEISINNFNDSSPVFCIA